MVCFLLLLLLLFFICLVFVSFLQGRGAKEYKCDLCQKIEKGSSTEELPVEVMPDSLETQSMDQIKPSTDEFSLTNGKVCIRTV